MKLDDKTVQEMAPMYASGKAYKQEDWLHVHHHGDATATVTWLDSDGRRQCAIVEVHLKHIVYEFTIPDGEAPKLKSVPLAAETACAVCHGSGGCGENADCKACGGTGRSGP